MAAASRDIEMIAPEKIAAALDARLLVSGTRLRHRTGADRSHPVLKADCGPNTSAAAGAPKGSVGRVSPPKLPQGATSMAQVHE